MSNNKQTNKKQLKNIFLAKLFLLTIAACNNKKMYKKSDGLEIKVNMLEKRGDNKSEEKKFSNTKIKKVKTSYEEALNITNTSSKFVSPKKEEDPAKKILNNILDGFYKEANKHDSYFYAIDTKKFKEEEKIDLEKHIIKNEFKFLDTELSDICLKMAFYYVDIEEMDKAAKYFFYYLKFLKKHNQENNGNISKQKCLSHDFINFIDECDQEFEIDNIQSAADLRQLLGADDE